MPLGLLLFTNVAYFVGVDCVAPRYDVPINQFALAINHNRMFIPCGAPVSALTFTAGRDAKYNIPHSNNQGANSN